MSISDFSEHFHHSKCPLDLSILFALIVSISSFANGHIAQCKLDNDNTSYVVASEDSNSKYVTVKGYGACANSTVVITVQSNISTVKDEYPVDIRNGEGGVRIPADYHLIKVDNIVCKYKDK